MLDVVCSLADWAQGGLEPAPWLFVILCATSAGPPLDEPLRADNLQV